MSVQIPLRTDVQSDPVRDLDPNVLQRRASNPLDSVWVSASAGTGKTKVLTDRVLRLLLPVSETQKGTDPHKILCLTFTKAAASEMALRVSKILARWAILPEEELSEKLEFLLGRPAQYYEIQAARRLFADVIDSSGGLQIMTIHAFCQSVLGRFPLEAGLTPGFTVLEEADASTLLLEARTFVFSKARKEVGSDLHQALNHIACTINEDQFFGLLLDGQKEQRQLQGLFESGFGAVDVLYQRLCEALDIPVGGEPEEVFYQYCQDVSTSDMDELCRTLGQGTVKTDQPKSDILRRWLDSTVEERVENFSLYRDIFLTREAQVRKTLMTKSLVQKFPQILEMMERTARTLLDLQDRSVRIRCAALTRDLFLLIHAILERYAFLKRMRGVLDFDDLILKVLGLLEGRGRNGLDMQGWVHYKLDQGLDHILIDEAQDTNPQQWQIIEALCDDFFAGQSGRDDVARTVFTVGDEKQSIYSFQRASPEEFQRMRAHFSDKIHAADRRWRPVDLNISFRSAPSVLRVVDHVFAGDSMRRGLGDVPLQHHSFRRGQAGLLELWPLCEDEDLPLADPWEPPTDIVESRSGSALLADKIADRVQNWLVSARVLESYGRPVQPGDIMILVRTRGRIVDQITRALKLRQIPVSGRDRMVLNDQLAVQDFLACAAFALLPEDDLTLACILKSPLIGLSEEDLFALCYERDGSLWDAVQESGFQTVSAYLKELRKQSRCLPPFEFFSWILQNPCPADDRSGQRAMKRRLGGDALEPLEELLNAALAYEADHVPSLQGFLQWQERSHSDIKREMENSGGAVRIMTVHGSKGLQAPIVILPDTTRSSRHVPGQSDKRLLWPEKTGLAFPLWAPRKDLEFQIFRDQFSILDERFDEEYKRLLYVAMTRAEDELYIAGYKGKRDPVDESWYYYVSRNLPHLEDVETLEDGGYRVSNPRIHDPDRLEDRSLVEVPEIDVPAWALSEAPSEPLPPRPLVPSRPSDMEPVALSPLQALHQDRFRRGNLTHKLLQVLPDLALDEREQAGRVYLQKFAADMEAAVQDDILAETLAVLNHTEFSPLFGPGSQAEVSVAGLVGSDMLISGQIDRLYIADDTIWIVDYKTNRPPPADVSGIPKIYYNQMRSYHDALQVIYPGRPVKCALLWTDGPRLMPLSF